MKNNPNNHKWIITQYLKAMKQKQIFQNHNLPRESKDEIIV